MARPMRRAEVESDTIPPHLATFRAEDWAEDEADDASELVSTFGVLFARNVLRHGRWSEARRAWLIAHRQWPPRRRGDRA